MSQRSYEERLAEIAMRQEQLKAQERDLKKRQSVDERKKRTKRLIELGAIIESVLGRSAIDEDKERLLAFLKRQESKGKFFSKAMNISKEAKEEEISPENNIYEAYTVSSEAETGKETHARNISSEKPINPLDMFKM